VTQQAGQAGRPGQAGGLDFAVDRLERGERTATGGLSLRQQAILKLIVQDYVQSGRPVGSKVLTERYSVGVSPATIRNEMAELEAAGYVQSLHTSGGRVPTDQGYRYFVHHLMGDVELPSADQIMIRHQFRQVELQLEQWIELAAAVLAETARNVSVVTAPRPAVPRLRHFELIGLQPRLALLILVTQESLVRQVVLHLPVELEQEELSRLADAIAPELRGKSADEIAVQAAGAGGVAAFVMDRLAATLHDLEAVARTEVRHSGLENILVQPEFAHSDAQVVLELLRGGAFLGAVLPQLTPGRDVQIFIGDENPADELRRFGVVLATYGVDGAVTGIVGVLGPTRMAYARSISSVRYMARLMSDLMAGLYSA
jgi:heat-inducible transcriptional repressor